MTKVLLLSSDHPLAPSLDAAEKLHIMNCFGVRSAVNTNGNIISIDEDNEGTN